MSITDINTYISLKTGLVGQINSDDTIYNIQTTLNSIASQKATILSNLSSSTVLDDGSGVSTSDKLNWIAQVSFCRLNDTQLFQIMISWFLRVDGQLTASQDPDTIATLTAKELLMIPIIKNVLPTAQLNLIKFIVQN